jgi:hypothetical protein
MALERPKQELQYDLVSCSKQTYFEDLGSFIKEFWESILKF